MSAPMERKPGIGEKIKHAFGVGGRTETTDTAASRTSEYERTIAKDIPVVGTTTAPIAAGPLAGTVADRAVGPTTGFAGTGAATHGLIQTAESAVRGAVGTAEGLATGATTGLAAGVAAGHVIPQAGAGQVISQAAEFRQEAPVTVTEAPVYRVAETEVRQLPTEFRAAGAVAGTTHAVVEERPVVTQRTVVHERPVVTERPVVLEKEVVTQQPVVHEKEVVHREVPIVQEQHVLREIPIEQRREIVTERPVVQETHLLQERHREEVLPARVEVSERVETLPLQTEKLPTTFVSEAERVERRIEGAVEGFVSQQQAAGVAQVPPTVGAPISGAAAPAPAVVSGGLPGAQATGTLPVGHHHPSVGERVTGAAGAALGGAVGTAERTAEQLTGTGVHGTHRHHHVL